VPDRPNRLIEPFSKIVSGSILGITGPLRWLLFMGRILG